MSLIFNGAGGCCCTQVPTLRPSLGIIPALIIGALLVAFGVLLIVSPLIAIALAIIALILFLIIRIIL